MNKDFQLSINNGPLFKADTFGREFTFAYYKELYKNQSGFSHREALFK